ncbi:MAG: hypothetical protein K2N72_01200 [Oscillospiraceae bacterium]|nr:hypothetical protein [Oscillospiraceae bacterium]
MANLEITKHPGELLLAEINEKSMTQKELAIRTNVSEKHISTVINGTKEISASFARRLDIALGAKSGTWAERQAEYDRYKAKIEEENGITDEELSILKSMKDVVDYFLKIGIMHNHCGDVEKVIQLRQILCVINLDLVPLITYNAAYRAQIKTSTSIDPYILFAWQRMCEILTENVNINKSFDSGKLYDCIPKIKELLFENDPNIMVQQLKKLFADCGVAFEVVQHFRGAPVQGFIKQTSNDKVILCLTIRGKKADKFWFSLFHEVGHLLNGDLNARFVDFDSLSGSMETKADIFARDTLIEPNLYKQFVSSGKYHSLEEIKKFSRYAKVPHWITIGRLHNDEWLDWSYFANEAPSYTWAK